MVAIPAAATFTPPAMPPTDIEAIHHYADRTASCNYHQRFRETNMDMVPSIMRLYYDSGRLKRAPR
jgi:hypothetical protein